MKKISCRLFPVLLLFVSVILPAQSQLFRIYDVRTDEYPLIKSKFIAFDEENEQITDLQESDFSINDNGKLCDAVLVQCPPKRPVVPLSAVLTLDVSGSMSGSNLAHAKAAAKAWLDAIPLGTSECAVTSFNSNNHFVCDFTTDKNLLQSRIDALSADGGTSFDAGFINSPAGALLVAESGIHKRVVVFLTDGRSEGDMQAIINKANSIGATVFCVTLGMNCPEILRQVAEKTGGDYFENITSKQQAEQVYLSILQIAQGSEPCELHWESPDCEAVHNVSVDLNYLPLTAHTDYSIDNSLFPVLKFFPSSSLLFGEILPGNTGSKQIRISSSNGNLQIYGITSSNQLFSVSDWGGSAPPFSLSEGENREISLEFAPQDKHLTYAVFNIESDACPDYNFYARGGFADFPPKENSLRLTHPNGGEVFLAGTDTIITWTGILPSEEVKLSYSTDNGSNWMKLADKATGLKYEWHGIPNTPSDQCLAKVTQEQDQDDNPRWVEHISSMDEVYSQDVDTDIAGDIIIVGIMNGKVNFGSGLILDVQNREGFIAKYNNAGICKWAMEAMVSSFSSAFNLCTDKDTNIIITGYFTGPAEFNNGTILEGSGFFIAKYDRSGNCLWATKADPNAESGSAVETAENNEIYVAGQFMAEADWGTGEVGSNGLRDVFLAKYSLDGVCEWVATDGGPYSEDYALDITVVKGDGVYVSGIYCGDPQDVSKNGALFSKYDFDGNEQWRKVIVGNNSKMYNSGNALCHDSKNNLYLAGRFNGMTDFGNGIMLTPQFSGDQNAFISKWKPDGTCQWAKSLGTNGNDKCTSLCINKNDMVYTTGYFYGQIAPEDSIFNKSNGLSDIFILRLDENGNIDWAYSAGGKNDDAGYGIASDMKSGVYATGIFLENVDFGNGIVLPGNNSNDSFLMKISEREIFQEDESDNLWSIVAPDIASFDIDMGTVAVGDRRDSVFRGFLSNNGTYPVEVEAIDFSSGHSHFYLISKQPPLTVQPGENIDFEFTFTPAYVGTHGDVIKIETNAGTLSQNIRGEGIRSFLQVEPELIDFGNIFVGFSKDTSEILLHNRGDKPIEIIETIMLGPDMQQFSILEGKAPFVLDPDESHTMKVRFAPELQGRTSGRIGFYYDDTGSPALAHFLGCGIDSESIVHIPDTTALVGEENFEIPVYLTVLKDAFLLSEAGYKGRISFRADCFLPMAPQQGTIENGMRIIEFSGKLGNKVDNCMKLFTLKGTVLHGELEYNPLYIDSFDWEDPELAASIINGNLTVSMCAFDLTKVKLRQMPMAVYPNPAFGKMNVASDCKTAGKYRLCIFNLQGKCKKKKCWSLKKPHTVNTEFDVSSLGSGLYQIVFSGPDQVFTMPALILR